MRYACLIYADEAQNPDEGSPEAAEQYDAYNAFSKKWAESGHIVGGEALLPISTATTVRMRNGEVLTTDGPFAETNEHLGGFFLIEAKDLDEAIQIASEIPDVSKGSIEVRPLMVFDEM